MSSEEWASFQVTSFAAFVDNITSQKNLKHCLRIREPQHKIICPKIFPQRAQKRRCPRQPTDATAPGTWQHKVSPGNQLPRPHNPLGSYQGRISCLCYCNGREYTHIDFARPPASSLCLNIRWPTSCSHIDKTSQAGSFVKPGHCVA